MSGFSWVLIEHTPTAATPSRGFIDSEIRQAGIKSVVYVKFAGQTDRYTALERRNCELNTLTCHLMSHCRGGQPA